MPADHDDTPSSGHEPTRLMPDGPLSTDAGRPQTHPTATIDGRRLRSGERLGEYVLRERLGHGGMGEVWRAEHLGLRRLVALKLMLRCSPTAWARFEREAKLAAGLDHPHIAKLYEFSSEPPFIAMQLIGGAAIAGASEGSIRALRDAALAVQHAHERGVLHRDLKPENIVVDDAGNAYVLDFGLAVPVEGEGERLTLSGEVVGTPAYMAPEQARGDARQIGRCSDVYGLGATLYSLLSSRPPFVGSGAWNVLHRVVDEEPERPGGDRDLETICLCAMAKDPRRRYPSAKAFADDLGRWLAREPVRARRAGIAYRLMRSVQRRPAVWTLGAALAGAVAIGAGFGVVQLARANAALEHALDIERRERSVQVEHARQLELEGAIESVRGELRELDDELARELDDARLAAAMARVDALAERLDALAAKWPDEGVVSCLSGQAALLRNREGAAIAAFDRALKGAEAPVSAKLGIRREASVGRALARLRRDFLDQMGRLFIFDDQSGYLAVDRGAAAIQADLDAAGADDDAHEREALTLWARYLRAAANPDRWRLYTEIHDQAVKLAARGGRHDEYARLLAGVLTGPPRRLEDSSSQYDVAIARAHSLPQAWLLRALERATHGDDDGARADCDQALRLRPDYALARLLRAQVDDAHPAKELADAEEAVRLAPEQPQCWLVRGRLEQGGDPAGALADLRQAAALAGGHPDYRGGVACRRQLADSLRQLGRRDEAIAAYRAVGDDGARIALAEMLEPDLAAGAKELGDLLVDEPKADRVRACSDARVWRAEARARAGDHEGSLTDWRWIRGHAPDVLVARTGEGEELAALGHRAEALAALDDAVEALRGWMKTAAGQGVPAGRVSARVAEALAARAQVRADAGDAGGAGDDCTAAEELYRKALAGTDANDAAREGLAKIAALRTKLKD